MKGNYSYYYDAESKIMYKSYFGEINIKDIESSWETASEQNLIPKNTKKFILDYREAMLKVKSTEHSTISDFYKTHPEIFNNALIAIVTDDPNNVVIPILVHEKDEGYISLPFSTMEAALEWLIE